MNFFLIQIIEKNNKIFLFCILIEKENQHQQPILLEITDIPRLIYFKVDHESFIPSLIDALNFSVFKFSQYAGQIKATEDNVRTLSYFCTKKQAITKDLFFILAINQSEYPLMLDYALQHQSKLPKQASLLGHSITLKDILFNAFISPWFDIPDHLFTNREEGVIPVIPWSNIHLCSETDEIPFNPEYPGCVLYFTWELELGEEKRFKEIVIEKYPAKEKVIFSARKMSYEAMILGVSVLMETVKPFLTLLSNYKHFLDIFDHAKVKFARFEPLMVISLDKPPFYLPFRSSQRVDVEFVDHLCTQLSHISQGTFIPMGNLSQYSSIRALIDQTMVISFCRKYGLETSVIPEKISRSQEKKDCYEGGLVLEPKEGIYFDPCITLDFVSHYPSIIVEHNLCLGGPQPFLPQLVRHLLDWRNKFRNQPSKRPIELVFKLLANTMYGYLAYPYSRFYSVHLAATITRLGREALQNLVQSIEPMRNIQVISGVTDSVTIVGLGMNRFQLLEQADAICSQVNAQYRFMKIQKEVPYYRLVILGKNRYYGMHYGDEEGKIVMKGVDAVQQDVCSLVTNLTEDIIDYMFDQYATKDDLMSHSTNIINWLYDLIHIHLKNTQHLTKLVIKNTIHDLLPAAQQSRPVFQVIRSEQLDVRAGDSVQWVMTEGGFPKSYAYARQHNVNIDKMWYLEKQIIPAMQRILKFVGDVTLEGFLSTFNVPQCSSLTLAKVNRVKRYRPSSSSSQEETVFNIKCPICTEKILDFQGFQPLYRSIVIRPHVHFSTLLPDLQFKCPHCTSFFQAYQIEKKKGSMAFFSQISLSRLIRLYLETQCEGCCNNLEQIYQENGEWFKFEKRFLF